MLLNPISPEDSESFGKGKISPRSMRISVIYFLLVLLLAGSSCKNSTESGTPSPFLINLTPGSHWKYKIEWKDQFSGSPMTAYDIVTIAPQKVSINGEMWDTVVHSSDYYAIPDFFHLLINRNDGVWARFDSGSPALHTYKYPAVSGESYRLDPIDTTGPNQAFNKAKMTGPALITAGNSFYSCYGYQVMLSGGHQGQIRNIYISPGYTIIKGVYITSSNSGWDTLTYTLTP